MHTKQRQRIADVICKEWNNPDNPPRYLESNALHECLAREGERVSNDALLSFLDELAVANLIEQREYIGSRRIEGIDPMLCEEPLNY
jgi:hypothetical protein